MDNDKVRLWNDIKVHIIITALDSISEFKEYLTFHVIGNPVLPSARDLVAAVTQYAIANRRLGRDLKAGEVQANAASSERTYTLVPCFSCRSLHLSVNCKEPKTTCRKCGRSGYLQEFREQISSRSPHFPKKVKTQDIRIKIRTPQIIIKITNNLEAPTIQSQITKALRLRLINQSNAIIAI